MNWAAWALIGWFALSMLVTVSLVGKPREPVTPGSAVTTVIIGAICCWLVVMAVSL